MQTTQKQSIWNLASAFEPSSGVGGASITNSQPPQSAEQAGPMSRVGGTGRGT